jgi:hypothetical protein
MRLPFLEIINLKLNDRIIVREKRFIINQYKTDLETFESNFELIQDLRQIDTTGSTGTNFVFENGDNFIFENNNNFIF